MSALSPFVTPDQFAALQKQVADLKKHIDAVSETVPPDYGIANGAQRGLLGKGDKAKLDGATQNSTPSTLVLRDPVGGVAFKGLDSGYSTAWTTVASIGSYANSWADEPTSLPVQYRRDALGFVHLRGVAYRTTGTPAFGEVIFSLPAGFRGTGLNELFPVITSTGAGQVNVGNDGTLHWRLGGAGYLSFSGISFEVVAL